MISDQPLLTDELLAETLLSRERCADGIIQRAINVIIEDRWHMRRTQLTRYTKGFMCMGDDRVSAQVRRDYARILEQALVCQYETDEDTADLSRHAHCRSAFNLQQLWESTVEDVTDDGFTTRFSQDLMVMKECKAPLLDFAMRMVPATEYLEDFEQMNRNPVDKALLAVWKLQTEFYPERTDKTFWFPDPGQVFPWDTKPELEMFTPWQAPLTDEDLQDPTDISMLDSAEYGTSPSPCERGFEM